MTDTKQKGISPVTAAITGAIVGAGVVATGVEIIAMQDDKNKKKVKDAFENVKGKAIKYVDASKKGIKDKKIELEKVIVNAVNNTNDKIHDKVGEVVNESK